jgi:hypothetical protein
MQALKAMTKLIWQTRKIKLIAFTSRSINHETAGVNDSCTYNYSGRTIAEK